jgi:hypothetical protein
MPSDDTPRIVIPDTDHAYIDPRYINKFDWEENLTEKEINEIQVEEEWIVNNYSNYLDLSLENTDLGDNSLSRKAPQVIRVISKESRTTSSGQVVVDYQLEIEQVLGASKYEIRVLQL